MCPLLDLFHEVRAREIQRHRERNDARRAMATGKGANAITKGDVTTPGGNTSNDTTTSTNTDLSSMYYRVSHFRMKHSTFSTRLEDQGILMELNETSHRLGCLHYIDGCVDSGMYYTQISERTLLESFADSQLNVLHDLDTREDDLGYIKKVDHDRFKQMCKEIEVPGKHGIKRVKGKRLPPLRRTRLKWQKVWMDDVVGELKSQGVLKDNME
jgi:hypothetical protein